MRSEIQNNDVKPELPFPKLMIAKDEQVVLFQGPREGVIIAPGQSMFNRPIGQYRTDWIPEAFTDFNGTITLSN